MATETQDLPLTHIRPTAPCTVCGKADAKACGRCRVDYYCGKQHQTQDWPRHKAGCGVVEMRRDEFLGRHLVAARDIPAGTVIMREVPVIIWPRPELNVDCQQTVCVGCCNVLSLRSPGLAKACEQCGWPVCGKHCAQRPEHQPECAAFQRAEFKLQRVGTQDQWSALPAIRMAEAASQDSMLKARLMDMQSEMPGIQQNAPMDFIAAYHETEKEFEKRLRTIEDTAINEMGLSWLSARELRRWAGVARFNSFTLHPHNGMCGLYAGGTVLQHACVPNTGAWSVCDDYKTHRHGDMAHVIVAVRDVAAGEHLSTSYVEVPFSWRPQRRRTLANTWCFHCGCALCADPTDSGLNLAAWYCGACQGRGCQRLVVLDDACEAWRCEGCGRGGRARGAPGELEDDDPNRAETYRLGERLRTLMAQGDSVPFAEWESYLSDALWPRGPLHHTSQLILQAKNHMVHHEPFLNLESAEDAGRLKGYCRDLLAAVEALCPGHLLYKSQIMKRLQTILIARYIQVMQSLQAAATTAGTSSPLPLPRLRQQLKDIKREYAEQCQEMKKYTVTPFEKENLEQSCKVILR